MIYFMSPGRFQYLPAEIISDLLNSTTAHHLIALPARILHI